MSLESFKASPIGARIAPTLTAGKTVMQMERLSRDGIPAVAAIDASLAAEVELNDTQKQQVGRWIRDIMAARGWRPLKQKRLNNGKLFSSGAVYGRIAASSTQAEPLRKPHGLDAVRKLVRDSSRTDYGLDDFIADKRNDVLTNR